METIQSQMQEDAFAAEIKKRKRRQLYWKIPLIALSSLVLLAVIAGIVVLCINDFTVRIAISGDEVATAEYGSVYEDAGAEAAFSGTLLLRQPKYVPVTAVGTVDTNTLGDQRIIYTASHTQHFWLFSYTFTAEAVRTVQVVDTTPPDIILTTDPAHYTLPGQPYLEEGFAATDGYDGEITHFVRRWEENGQVIYTVTDRAGNTARAVREIVYHDPVSPVIHLNGSDKITVYQGNSYVEPGYTATDNCDGDLTDKVVCSGSVDSSVLGVYPLQYTVTDSYQNTATAVRYITVMPQAGSGGLPQLAPAQLQSPVTPSGKVIYLTFDDGPGEHTQRLLDILDRHNVKATFFVVNSGYMHLLPRMAEAGHTVAMHTASHRYDRIYSSEYAYFADLQSVQNAIEAQIGTTPTIFRFPGGSSNVVSRHYNPGIMRRLASRLKALGYRYFDWNVDSRDAAGARDANEIYFNVIGGIEKRDVSIVLMHDIYGKSVDAVESIIIWGLSNGYSFQALTPSSPVCEHPINN